MSVTKETDFYLFIYCFNCLSRDLETNLSLPFLYRSSGGVVDGGQSYQKNMTEEISKLQRLYGGGDMTKFPDFKFTGLCQISSLELQ